MPISRNKLYGLLISGCVVGYVWIFFNLAKKSVEHGVCLIKHITNVPCPSCGTTRSILSIVKGEILHGLYLNPFGFILILILIILPMWVGYDVLKKNNSLLRFYGKTETFLKQKKIAIPSILFVVANWFWNIYKGL